MYCKGSDDCRMFCHELEQTLPLVFADHLTVYDLSESGDFPGKFFVLLDQVPEEHWKSLGDRLDVDPKILEGIKTDCATQHQNPAQEVIELIYTSHPTMTIHMFKEKLKEIKREDIVIKQLDGLRSK